MLKKVVATVLMMYAAVSFAAVDVNKATAAELDAVKGIGPAISGKILDERKKGAFKDWNDFVDRVSGIGEGNAAKLSAEGLTIGGASFKGMAAPASKKDDKPLVAKEAKAKEEAKAKAAAEDKANEKAKVKSDTKAKADDKKADAPKPAASTAKK